MVVCEALVQSQGALEKLPWVMNWAWHAEVPPWGRVGVRRGRSRLRRGRLNVAKVRSLVHFHASPQEETHGKGSQKGISIQPVAGSGDTASRIGKSAIHASKGLEYRIEKSRLSTTT